MSQSKHTILIAPKFKSEHHIGEALWLRFSIQNIVTKGLEWKTVILLDDFFGDCGSIPNGILSNSNEVYAEDEKNILYVAMTRAKTNLVFNFAAFNLMLTGGDTFERIVNLKNKKVILKIVYLNLSRS